jgi:hypothetical protein
LFALPVPRNDIAEVERMTEPSVAVGLPDGDGLDDGEGDGLAADPAPAITTLSKYAQLMYAVPVPPVLLHVPRKSVIVCPA